MITKLQTIDIHDICVHIFGLVLIREHYLFIFVHKRVNVRATQDKKWSYFNKYMHIHVYPSKVKNESNENFNYLNKF